MIAIEGLSKTYRSWGRTVRAVDDVTLQIHPGEVVGIAGPNGAGKTTLVAMLLGFLRPTSGRLTIDGRPPREYVERHGLAYQPELMALPRRWTVDRALHRLLLLAGVPASETRTSLDSAIASMDLSAVRRKTMRSLSKGTFQRVGLAQTLLRDERVVIFDEPTHGLDPIWTQRFREIVAGLRRPDRIIIVASHNLDELERVADRVAIVDQGRIQRVVSMRSTIPSDVGVFRVTVLGDPNALLAYFPGAIVLPDGTVELPVLDPAALCAGLGAALSSGVVVVRLSPREGMLEAAFHSAVGRAG